MKSTGACATQMRRSMVGLMVIGKKEKIKCVYGGGGKKLEVRYLEEERI